MTWLATRFLGLARGWWLLIAAAAIAALVAFALGAFDRVLETATEAGAAIQRAEDLTETIQRTETGNAAREEIRTDADGARYAQCLRTARTPANCERFLP